MFSAGRLAIGICGRCGMTYDYVKLREDGNVKGLYVCPDGCYDEIDPYKLPPRPPDSFVLHHPRPDAELTLSPTEEEEEIIEGILTDESGDAITDESGEPITIG